jgi:hypothetical protein
MFLIFTLIFTLCYPKLNVRVPIAKAKGSSGGPLASPSKSGFVARYRYFICQVLGTMSRLARRLFGHNVVRAPPDVLQTHRDQLARRSATRVLRAMAGVTRQRTLPALARTLRDYADAANASGARRFRAGSFMGATRAWKRQKLATERPAAPPRRRRGAAAAMGIRSHAAAARGLSAARRVRRR